jgi:hypothetical protein
MATEAYSVKNMLEIAGQSNDGILISRVATF